MRKRRNAVTRKVHAFWQYIRAHAHLPLLLTFYLTKKHLHSIIYDVLRKSLRGCWYVFRIRENPAVQDIPSAILLFLMVGMRWVCSRDSAGTQLAARGFPRYKVGNLCWFWAKRRRARDERCTLTYILFSTQKIWLMEKGTRAILSIIFMRW